MLKRGSLEFHSLVMKRSRSFFPAVVFLTLMTSGFKLPAQTFTEPNPALIYWQGISHLPDFSKEQSQLIHDVLAGKTSPSPESADAIIQSGERALGRFKRAAQSPQPCDWGITLDEGPHAMMPHLPKMQHLSRLALFKAESLFAAGKTESAFEWILLVQKSARHMGAGGGLIAILVEQTIEIQAIQVAARQVLSTESSLRKVYLEGFLKLPPLPTARNGLQSERLMADWLQRRMLGVSNSAENEKALLDLAETFFQTLPEQQARDFNEATGMKDSVETWKKMAGETRAFYDRIDLITTKPWSEALPEIQKLQSEIKQSNAITRSFFPPIAEVLRKELELKTRYTMLQAALMLGPDLKPGPLENYRDAFEDKPLLVQPEGNVFKIVMQNKINGREISMKIGR